MVFPCESFDVSQVVDAVSTHRATVLFGVPTMFFAEIAHIEATGRRIVTLVKAIAGGSSVPGALVGRVFQKMGAKLLVGYGMTESSPVAFGVPFLEWSEKRLGTVGKILPHTFAKIIDREGNIVRRGERGELCLGGYCLQRGYWRDEQRTNEVMKKDENGVLWLFTGDECVIEADGYCTITARLKDIIIRGKSNQLFFSFLGWVGLSGDEQVV